MMHQELIPTIPYKVQLHFHYTLNSQYVIHTLLIVLEDLAEKLILNYIVDTTEKKAFQQIH